MEMKGNLPMLAARTRAAIFSHRALLKEMLHSSKTPWRSWCRRQSKTIWFESEG